MMNENEVTEANPQSSLSDGHATDCKSISFGSRILRKNTSFSISFIVI